MAVEGRAPKTGSSVAQGIEDLAQSWAHLAREMAPEVPELPAVLQQEVVSLNVGEITEERLNQVAHAIVQRVSDAGFSEKAAALQRRMGRAMYELLLLIATEEELRTMGMLLEAAEPPIPAAAPSPVTATSPTAPGPNSNLAVGKSVPAAQSPVAAPSSTPQPRPASPQAARPPSSVVAAPRTAPPTAAPLPTPVMGPPPGATVRAALPEPARSATPTNSAPPAVPPAPTKQAHAVVSVAAAAPLAKVPLSPSAAPMFTRVEAPPLAPPPAAPVAAEAVSEEAGLWGFDPAERESPAEMATGLAPAAVDEAAVAVEPALAVESRPAGSAPVASTAGSPAASPHGWTVRLSPRATRERENRLRKRLDEIPALTDEIVAQVHAQRRAVSDRGTAREAVRAASEQAAPSELAVAVQRMAELIDGHRLTEAAALALRASEAFPGESSAELACRAGEAARHSKDDELATLCFTTSVLAAPPGDPACWQLAGMALERKDPRLAPIWMEFLAKLLRARGADEDAVVVYRQLLSLTPRREDVRDILRVASLTGVLPD